MLHYLNKFFLLFISWVLFTFYLNLVRNKTGGLEKRLETSEQDFTQLRTQVRGTQKSSGAEIIQEKAVSKTLNRLELG
jgi:hypothetical protein